jgi:hypothetical protein
MQELFFDFQENESYNKLRAGFFCNSSNFQENTLFNDFL